MRVRNNNFGTTPDLICLVFEDGETVVLCRSRNENKLREIKASLLSLPKKLTDPQQGAES